MSVFSGPVGEIEKEAEEFVTYVNKVAPALVRSILDALVDYEINIGGMPISIKKHAS